MSRQGYTYPTETINSASKFTSLVRASSANPLVRYCHFGVSPVNYSDSDSVRPTVDQFRSSSQLCSVWLNFELTFF